VLIVGYFVKNSEQFIPWLPMGWSFTTVQF